MSVTAGTSASSQGLVEVVIIKFPSSTIRAIRRRSVGTMSICSAVAVARAGTKSWQPVPFTLISILSPLRHLRHNHNTEDNPQHASPKPRPPYFLDRLLYPPCAHNSSPVLPGSSRPLIILDACLVTPTLQELPSASTLRLVPRTKAPFVGLFMASV